MAASHLYGDSGLELKAFRTRTSDSFVQTDFNPLEYYASYGDRVIARPGYPARGAYKAALLVDLFAHDIYRHTREIRNVADVGGCFGFGANSLAFHLARRQRTSPAAYVFELAEDFIALGKHLFPNIHFVQHDVLTWQGDVDVFDLAALIDVLEHIVDPSTFLQQLSKRCRFLLLKTPLETTGEWRGNRPIGASGTAHPDGHVNFFNPQSLESLLTANGFQLLRATVLKTIVPPGGELALAPEYLPPSSSPQMSGWRHHQRTFKRALSNMVPYRLLRRWFGGGDHLCICISNNYLANSDR